MSEQNINSLEGQPAEPATTLTPAEKADRFFTQAEVDRIVKERLDRESKKREDGEKKAREQAEADAMKRNAEWEKLAKQREEELEKVNAELEKVRLVELKRSVAAKYGIPDALIERLKGSTAEEIDTDAKTIADILPRAPKTPNLNPTNPSNPSTGETRAQALARIHGATIDVFDPSQAEKMGGGVMVTEKGGEHQK